MKGTIYIDHIEIGYAMFTITDEAMGGIVGQLVPNENYNSYKDKIQALTASKGIASIEDFQLHIKINNEFELRPTGGIGITDIPEIDEIIVESAGIDHQIIEKMKNAKNR